MQTYNGDNKQGNPFVKEFDNLAMMYEWLRRQSVSAANSAAPWMKTCVVDYVDSRSPRL
jgi:hypothetical protein